MTEQQTANAIRPVLDHLRLLVSAPREMEEVVLGEGCAAMVRMARDLGSKGLDEFFRGWVAEHRRLLAFNTELEKNCKKLVGVVDSLTTSPNPIARVQAADAARRRCVVTMPGDLALEVGIDSRTPVDSIQPGHDARLNKERTTVLCSLGWPAPRGPVRTLPFKRWCEAVAPNPATAAQALRLAVLRDGDREVVVQVPAPQEAVLQQRSAKGLATSCLVDRNDQVVGVEASAEADPMVQASRFAAHLPAVAPEEIVGLAAQRQLLQRAVDRLPEEGAIVLASGPPGSGKTLLAGHVRHLLAQRGDVVALTLRASPEHRYWRQEESDIEDLCVTARTLAQRGKQVLVFVDEIDRFFYRPGLPTMTVHDNSTRATWLAHLGSSDGLRGVLFYATTNKASELPDELLNRVHFSLNFERLDAATARGIFACHLPAEWGGAAREDAIDAVVDALFDRAPGAAVVEVLLRDQSRTALFCSDLRQLSARFLVELARRLRDDPAGAPAPEQAVEQALAVAYARIDEVVGGVRLTPANVAERTFLTVEPRNPVESIHPVLALRRRARSLFRYAPVEVERG